MTNSQKIKEVLVQLKDDAQAIDPVASWGNENTIEKHDMILIGENFNKIDSIEFCHSLKDIHDIDISYAELLNIIPVVCESLNMKNEPAFFGEDTSNLAGYYIELF
ncbi:MULTISPECIES: hypothetical protein [Peribacillus]|uniref:Uncharacterized protein n=1 Tax=Peribacillus simplex TaxID=1478 RepID=A0A125QSE1_9BACI|nr:hypothetical protein [Peribacillus simplex]KWW21435.1 hypothetical protein AS888_17820 [Peribacillus simplex]